MGSSPRRLCCTYRHDGLRQSKTTGGVTTGYIWNGDNIIAELDNSYNIAVTYTRGIGLIYSETNGTRQYYLHNAHGDVTALTNTSGTVVKSYDYDAFGVEKNPVATDANPFRYCGEYYDRETGSYYLRARYYNPKLGRFTQQDPASDGLNWYTYCNGNPILYVDPTGCVNYVTQSHLLVGGYAQKGWNIVDSYNPNSLSRFNFLSQASQSVDFYKSVGSLAQGLLSGSITGSELLQILGDSVTEATIGDILYIKDNANQFRSDVDITNDQAWALGERTAGAIWQIEQAGFTVYSLGAAVKNFVGVKDLSTSVAKKFGGTVTEFESGKGKLVTIPNGKKQINVRIMNAGSGGREAPYFRVTIPDKSALDINGKLSNSAAATHFDINGNSLNTIVDIINKYLGK